MSGICDEGMTAAEYFLYKKKQPPSRHVGDMCRRYLGGGEETSVLDVGCGVGFGLKQMAGSTGERVSITGCDTDPELLRFAADVNKEVRGRVAVACSGESSLPFATGFFDIVYSEASLHHFDDAHGMIGEMWRVLKPGGVLVIVDLNPESPLSAAYAVFAETAARLGIAGKGGVALARSIRDALPEKKVVALFAGLGINCRVSRSRGSIWYEAQKPHRPA